MELELLEDQALILQSCMDGRYSVRELVNRLPMHSNKTVDLLKSLESSGLLAFEIDRSEASRGRPRKMAVVTELGAEFLGTFKKLERRRLLINDNEVRRVVEQVERDRRLEAIGVDLQQRMLEIIEFARLLRKH